VAAGKRERQRGTSDFVPMVRLGDHRQADADPDTVRARTLVYCSDPLVAVPLLVESAPGEGLPLITVDTEIYRLVPAMVIATADKFAQVPWRGPTRALFGRVTRRMRAPGYRHPGTSTSR